jgi:hypothetical protein
VRRCPTRRQYFFVIAAGAVSRTPLYCLLAISLCACSQSLRDARDTFFSVPIVYKYHHPFSVAVVYLLHMRVFFGIDGDRVLHRFSHGRVSHSLIQSNPLLRFFFVDLFISVHSGILCHLHFCFFPSAFSIIRVLLNCISVSLFDKHLPMCGTYLYISNPTDDARGFCNAWALLFSKRAFSFLP